MLLNQAVSAEKAGFDQLPYLLMRESVRAGFLPAKSYLQNAPLPL